MLSQCPEVLKPGWIVYLEDVEWPLMGVKAPEQFEGGIDYTGRTQAAKVVEVYGAADNEEGEVEEVEDAIDVT